MTNARYAAVWTQLDETIQAALGDVFPAAALAIYQHGNMVAHSACGWVTPDEIATETGTMFDLASLTKLFTVTAFLSLASEGKVMLDTPLVDVIPEFAAQNPRPIDGGFDPQTKERLPTPPDKAGQTVDATQVTFRHLLTHTAGLAPWLPVYSAAGEPPLPPLKPDPTPRRERWWRGLSHICAAPFVDEVGRTLRYSDVGMLLLGEAVTRLHGEPLENAIYSRITEPLNLNALDFRPLKQGCERSQIAPTEYDADWRKRRVWGEVHDRNACGVGGVAGHAGLFGDVQSVAAFGQAWLMRDSRLNITPELMGAAVSEQFAGGNIRYGYGWRLNATGDPLSANAYGHTGFTGTSLWVDPERALVVALLTNRVYMGRSPAIHDFRRRIHDIIAAGV